MKNVIFLTMDAWRADRTSLFGYARKTTPNLEFHADNALAFSRTYSQGAFTQTAMVQLLTSSRPLSFGGFDHGAIGRPESVFATFQRNNYHTTCMSTLHWVNQFFGYGEGLNEEYQLFDFIPLAGVSLNIMRKALQSFGDGEMSEEEVIQNLGHVLIQVFNDIEIYCDIREKSHPKICEFYPDSPLVHSGFDIPAIRSVISKHRHQYLRDPIAYLKEHLIPAPTWADWMERWLPRDFRKCRTKIKLAQMVLERTYQSALSVMAPHKARAHKNRFKISVDIHALVNHMIHIVDSRKAEKKPFFIWAHSMDTHAPYVSGAGKHWADQTRLHLQALGYDESIDTSIAFDGKPGSKTEGEAVSALYDAAIRSSDQAVGRLLDYLDNSGLAEDTIVVLAGDHGEELGEHGDFGHFFLLYEHNVHVPFVIINPSISGRKIEELSTTTDIAPTFTTLAGISPPASWEGENLLLSERLSRDSVLLETFYGGSCLFDRRPLYFAVRFSSWHYLWKEYRDPDDRYSPEGHELYDMNADPDQQINLYDPAHPMVLRGNEIIRERMVEIGEFDAERINRALPET